MISRGDTRNGISVLKPLKGIDDQLERNLESFFNLDYPKFELLFGVNDPDDPAIPIVKRLKRKYPGIQAKLIINPDRIGLNPKINNLNNIFVHARYEYILISDSNVRVPGLYLQDMMAHLLEPNTGLVVSIFRGTGAKSIASMMENIHLNTFILSSVYTVKKLFNIPITIGKSMLFRKSFLNRFNVFYGLRDFLAEDHLLGLQVLKAGMEVAYSSIHIDNYNENWSFERFINRHLRWAKMRKHLNLVHYLTEPVANPVFTALAGLLIIRTTEALLLAGMVLSLKMMMDIALMQMIKTDMKWYQYTLIPLKDVLMGAIWLIPFFHNRVNWRGTEFRITRGTRLVSVT